MFVATKAHLFGCKNISGGNLTCCRPCRSRVFPKFVSAHNCSCAVGWRLVVTCKVKVGTREEVSAAEDYEGARNESFTSEGRRMLEGFDTIVWIFFCVEFFSV